MFVYAEKRVLSETFQLLGGQPGAWPPRGLYRDRVFTALWTPPAKNTPSYLALHAVAGQNPGANPVPASSAGYRSSAASAVSTAKLHPLLIRRETSTDKWGKRIGLNREVQLGDPNFDDQYYLETRMEEPLVRAVLGDARVRALVDRLLAGGASEVVLYNGANLVSVRWPSVYQQTLTREGLFPILEELYQLAALLPHDAPSPRARTEGAAVAAVLALCLLPVLAMVPAMLLSNDYSPLAGSIYGVGILGGLLLAALSAFPLAMLLRGRSNSLRLFGIGCATIAFAVPSALTAGLLFVNGAFDSSTPVDRNVLVLSRTIHRGKSTSYSVRLQHWDSTLTPLRFSVSYSLFYQLPEGSLAHFRTHDGALGWAWYDQLGPARVVDR